MRYCVLPENDCCQNAVTVTCIWSFLLVRYSSSTIQTCFAQSEENVALFTVASLLEAAAATNNTGLSFFKVTKMHNILHLPPEKQLPLQSFSIHGMGGVWLKSPSLEVSQVWRVSTIIALLKANTFGKAELALYIFYLLVKNTE